MDSDIDGLFPLPLSTFEQFTLIDDTRDYPMTFFTQIRVKGTVDVDAVQQALEESIRRHPLLCCKTGRSSGSLCWEWSPELMPKLRVVAEHEPLWHGQAEFIDLNVEAGLRVWLRPLADRMEFTYQFHHACCDGIGSLQFLLDFAMAYARRTAPHTLRRDPQRLDLERLRTRAAVLNRREIANRSGFAQRIRRMVRLTFKHLSQRPAPIKAPQDSGTRSPTDIHPGEPRIYSQLLDKATSRKLRQTARQANATVNDLLLRDLLVCLNHWNSEIPGDSRRRDLRILVPTSLRAEGDQETPAANILGYVFITRKPSQLADKEQLLVGIRNDTQAILRLKLGWLFLDSLHRLKRLGVLRFAKSTFGRDCQATAIHSHLGNAYNQFRSNFVQEDGQMTFGNLQLVEVLSTPPIRPFTHIALATYSSAGQLTINMRCDATILDSQDATKFMDSYVSQLVQSASDIRS